jgi:hypothetical protein
MVIQCLHNSQLHPCRWYSREWGIFNRHRMNIILRVTLAIRYMSMYMYNHPRTLHFLFLQDLLELRSLRSYLSLQVVPVIQYLHNSQLHPMLELSPGMGHTLCDRMNIILTIAFAVCICPWYRYNHLRTTTLPVSTGPLVSGYSAVICH